MTRPRAGRIVSVDVMRGATIAAMVIVNNPGSWVHVFGPLSHAPWHGCTPTDLIFPFFLFVAGVSAGIALPGAAHPAPRILRRVAILFALGLLLNGFPGYHLATLRVMGVLQRIAVCYGLASIAVLTLPRVGQAALAAVLLLAYWAMLAAVPAPGHPPFDLTRDGCLPGFVDRAVLGRNHLWEQGPIDPEGILSTISALGTTLCGCVAGALLREGATASRAIAFSLAGAGATAAGWVWSRILPLNKSLWTSSYALFTAGIALLALAVAILLFDLGASRRLAMPFEVFGRNAILLFVGSGVLARLIGRPRAFVFKHALAPLLGPLAGSLAWAILLLLLYWLLLLPLYRRRGFLVL
ncbi:MAG: heparan-alpha-glucosaminide N-acetyltransferase domain-containing protein [bacterium]